METPLHEYERKRRFGVTPEPRGGALPGERRRFVVQKHDARRLHYDFRLELDGVLKSWAIPKGPSYDPKEKRLAVHVEDHPVEYADFEGVIPEGQYGAGAVLVWDFGTWEPIGDARRAYAQGRLHFRLHGARLAGEWVLARMGGAAAGANKENWLLLKVNDAVAREHAQTDGAARETDSQETSVLSGRTLAQIALAPDATWSSGGQIGAPTPPASGAPFPAALEPQLATLVERPPRGNGWLHEIKFDGYRTLARVHQGTVQLISRNGKDWTDRFGAVARAIAALPLRDGWLDGEVTVMEPDGRTSFGALQRALSEKRDVDLVYFLFDLLYRDGADLRALPLTRRKAALADLLAGNTAPALRLGEHVIGEGDHVWREACRLGLEGVVCKRADAPWRPGRGRDWVKVKCLRRQEFVIGGFSAPAGARSGFGALLVGVYERDRLIYTGRVGTGYDEQTLRDLHARLVPLATPSSPFTNAVPKGRGTVTWVRPELVAEVAFAEWTRDGILRQPVFQGLREDKPPREIGREGPGARIEEEERGDRIAGIRLSHPEKLLFPEERLTKRDVARYYDEIAAYVLPDLKDRPLTLVRCPDGNAAPCFYQKHATEALPDGIARIPVREDGGHGLYLAVTEIAGVVGLVQMGVLEIHTWGAHSDEPERPDRLVFDLDPDEGLPWEAVVDAARLVREVAETVGLQPFLRATGGKGLHVVVPLARRHTWPEVKEFAHALVRTVAHAAPERYTINPAKPARRGKVYLDYLRNARGATAIANYSTRARPGAPVAVPLHWDELGTPADAWRVDNVRRRLAGLATDPWDGYDAAARALTRAMKRAVGSG
jgi:bifunctional non-homologous end joining protein LigD